MNFIYKVIRFFIPKSIIKKLKVKYQVPDMEWSLCNLKVNGFNPSIILDIGAYEGEWTRMCNSIFNDSKILMFEAQESKIEKLSNLKSNKIDFCIALLGAKSSQKSKFYINDTVSSALPESEKVDQNFQVLPMYTLDEQLQYRGINKVDFIKLDVQGYELEVLKGADIALSTAEVILMEVSLIEINKGAPLIAEVMAFMTNKGFVCYDICSIMRRPLDKALWQTDLIFVKQDSKLIESKNYE